MKNSDILFEDRTIITTNFDIAKIHFYGKSKLIPKVTFVLN